MRGIRGVFAAVVLLFSLGAPCFAGASPWVTVYYLGLWTKRDRGLQPEGIDYSAFSHIIYFGIGVYSDGHLDTTTNNVGSPASLKVIRLAHQAGKKISVCIGRPIDYRDMNLPKAPHHWQLKKTVENVMNIVARDGYDGVDVDWEPLVPADHKIYTNYIRELRSHLDALAKRKHRKEKYLLTAAVADEPGLFAKIQNYFDQINLMTYDLSGAWLNQTWHNTALFSPPPLPDDEILPSVDQMIGAFHHAGVALSKLAAGVEFYGYLWSGGTASDGGPLTRPRQAWAHAPTVTEGVPYTDIIHNYFPAAKYAWDDLAQSPFLGFAGSPKIPQFFVSYENENSIQRKVEYVKKQGLGGLMAWELGGAYFPDSPVQEPLLEAMKTLLEPHDEPWQNE